MKTPKLLSAAVTAAIAVLAQNALAQPSGVSSRADVKASTSAAARAGTLAPAGEGPGTMTSSQAGTTPGVVTRPAGTATTTGPVANTSQAAQRARAERKTAARAATRTKYTNAGEHVLPLNADQNRTAMAATSREAVKAETRAATMAGQIRNGEAPRPLAEPPKK